MVSSIQKLNMFTQSSALQGINPVKSGETNGVLGGNPSKNPFASAKDNNTVGINTNFGVGDSFYLSNQLGKSGIGRTIGIA